MTTAAAFPRLSIRRLPVCVLSWLVMRGVHVRMVRAVLRGKWGFMCRDGWSPDHAFFPNSHRFAFIRRFTRDVEELPAADDFYVPLSPGANFADAPFRYVEKGFFLVALSFLPCRKLESCSTPGKVRMSSTSPCLPRRRLSASRTSTRREYSQRPAALVLDL